MGSSLTDSQSQIKPQVPAKVKHQEPVNDMWVKFKTGFVEAVERFIASKMTKTKYSVLWMDVTIKRLVNKET